MKMIQKVVIGVVIAGVLGIGGKLLLGGLKTFAQEAAKEALKDTTGQNSDSIAELKKLVAENIKEDHNVHPQIQQLKAEIESLKVAMRDLKIELRETNKKLQDQQITSDELTKLMIQYMQSHNGK